LKPVCVTASSRPSTGTAPTKTGGAHKKKRSKPPTPNKGSSVVDTPSKTRVTSKVVYQNPWITIHEDETVDTAGNKGIYGYMESRDSCMVIVLDDQHRIYFVRSF